MNIYTVIILAALAAEFILHTVTDYLNLRALDDALPEEFEGVCEKETYRKSQEYARVTTRFGFVTSTAGMVLVLAFWFSGGFNWLDGIVSGWAQVPVWRGLLYIGILMFARKIVFLPFSIYRVFVIEERFEFNRTTPGTFAMDQVKGLILTVVIAGPLIAGILLIFEYAGAAAWLYCWAVTALVIIFLQFVAPTWIMPLFNKFTPLEAGELRDAIMNYARSVNFSLKGIFVMDGSRRSTKSNAFFTGFGKNKRIALFDTLIAKHTVGELVAVLAHEIGHYKKKHILQNMLISILHVGVVFYLVSIFITQEGLFSAFFMEKTAVYTGLIFFGLLYTPIEMVLSTVMNMLSRKNEYQADRYAAVTTGKGEDLVTALKKLSVTNLSNLTPHPMKVFLNYSHPPVIKRIEAIRSV